MKLPEFSSRSDQPFFLFAGPCVIETEELALQTASYLGEVTASLGIGFVYKSSFKHIDGFVEEIRKFIV